MRYFAVFYQHHQVLEDGTQITGFGHTTMRFPEFPSNYEMEQKVIDGRDNLSIVLTGWNELRKEDYLRYLGKK